MTVEIVNEEHAPISGRTGHSQVRVIKEASLIAMYSAVAIASSLVVVTIPNLETITLFIFLVSYRHGFWRGLNMAILTLILYEFIVASVWGSAGLLFLFKFPPQIFTVLVGALAGSQFHSLHQEEKPVDELAADGEAATIDSLDHQLDLLIKSEIDKDNKWWGLTIESLIFGLIGFIVTLFYDAFTSLSFLIFTPEIRSESLVIAFLLGVPFYLFHEITNFLLFMAMPLLNEALDKTNLE